MRRPRLRDASAVHGVYLIVYQHLGARTLSLSACVLALGAALVAWFALATPAFREPEVRH